MFEECQGLRTLLFCWKWYKAIDDGLWWKGGAEVEDKPS